MHFAAARVAALLSLVLASAASAAETVAPSSSVDQAWRDASLSLFKESHRAFLKEEGREALVGRAITLLAQQPKTAGNIEDAVRLLEEVVAEKASDRVGIMARYYLGRIEQIHRTPADPVAAAGHFRRLVEEHAGDPWADQAAVKLALIELHEQIPAEELRDRFARHRDAARALKTPAARRDLYLLLADVAQRFGLGDSLALEALLEADRAGIARATAQAQVWVQIGELARGTGRNDVARAHYEKFLATFERDNRRTMVSAHLAGLPPAVAAASAP